MACQPRNGVAVVRNHCLPRQHREAQIREGQRVDEHGQDQGDRSSRHHFARPQRLLAGLAD